MSEDLRDQLEDKATIVIAAADGKRHGTPGVDLTSDEVHLEDLSLAKSSLERIGKQNLSAGEALIAEQVSHLEKHGSL